MKKAFTLIELLVVLAIIGILAAMIIASLSNARARARDTQRKSDLRQIKTANEQYYQDHNQAYTAALADLAPDYMRAIPTDPSTHAAYTYAVGAPASDYYIAAALENRNETDTVGVTCLTAGGGNGVCTSGGTKYFQVSND